MNSNHMKRIFLLAALCLSPFIATLNAQEDGELETEEVEIIKDFDARLEETEKVNLSPELPPVEGEEGPLNYLVPTKLLGVQYPPPKIRPIAMRRDKVPDAYAGYLKAGYGTPNSPYAEASYHLNKEEEYAFGAFLKHHSANFKDRENQRFSLSTGNVYGTYFFDQGFAANGNLGYTSDVVHLYGYDDQDTSFAKEKVERNISTFEVGGKFFNGESTVGDLNYYAGANLYRLSESFEGSKETGFVIDMGITKYFDEKHPLNIRLVTDFTDYRDTARQELHNFYLQPNFSFHADLFNVKVGANIVSHEDEFRFYPDLEISVSILGSQLAAFAGWNGNLQKNTLRSLLAYNPFVSSFLTIGNTSYNDFYGGVKGNINNIEYQGQVGYKPTKDLALFLNSPDDFRQLNVLYDTVDIFYIKGSIVAQPMKDLEVLLSLSNSFFDPKNAEKPWHLPALEGNASLIYTTAEEKVKIRAELYLANGVPFLDENADEDRLNGLYDISIGGEYFFTKNIGAFLQLNNLANNRRERWYRYPVYGLNVLGGVTARF
jgi:hypothetical protein